MNIRNRLHRLDGAKLATSFSFNVKLFTKTKKCNLQNVFNSKLFVMILFCIFQLYDTNHWFDSEGKKQTLKHRDGYREADPGKN